MEPTRSAADPEALSRRLVEHILMTGMMLADLIADLVEGLPQDAFPGEEPAEVLLEMLAGSSVPAVRTAGVVAVERTIELLTAVGNRTLDDLRQAAELARARMEEGEAAGGDPAGGDP